MIRYPNPIRKGQTIGVTATSSGVESELHHLLRKAAHQFEQRGFSVKLGDTVWTDEKLTSTPKGIRTAEFNEMMESDEIAAIIPPWGGHFLIEILPLIDFDQLRPKWIVGYSDTSTLLLSITLMTGIATAHGTNFVDVRSDAWDPVTAKFLEMITAETGATIVQQSSEKYQSEWQHFALPDPYVFKLDCDTEWKVIDGDGAQFEGRLLAGCIDTIRHLVGTPFGDVKAFQKKCIPGDQIIWALENCDLDAPDFYRSILQLYNAGWFDHASGIIFGRTAAGEAKEGFTDIDAMERLAELTGIPIVYDADIGHVPPQMTFVNGAYGKATVKNGKGKLETSLI
ncbi:S66 peptidase family protein [Sporosarcina sp. HYO08]|uniref:S66 family peptidase n=1 Tax=Sporosarcina sp. HYO08 TaxID=1759557 RepID=UPI0007993D20|nr:S66 peptidase family protein [Sporosarcina sp. HYO08]KXH87234.1 peptidase S66 [Sporosarcina sp. HYO08]